MKKKAIIVSSLLAAAALIFWFFYPIRSMLVMSIYSAQQSSDSVMRRNGFGIDMPSGAGWYPFVMTYNAEGFPAWSGIDADMSIMYNFGAFDLGTRTSSIYNTGSDKYSAFYGAYALKKNGGEFGFFEDSSVDMDEVKAAFAYDYKELVLSAFGCGNPVFAVDGYEIKENAYCAGSEGWTRIDAQITASGAAHNYAGYRTPYLQYGRPMKAAGEDFAQTKLFGRMYMKYFEEYGCTVLVYVTAPSVSTADECDSGIFSKTLIKALK